MPAPSFIGVGMQKSGTRWLYQQLRAHPDLWMPPLKEFHFFDAPFPSPHARTVASKASASSSRADQEFGRRLLAIETRRDQPLATYFSLFEPAEGRVTGEITPSYAALPEDAIGRLAAAMPGTKVLLMVRDPVERAWSALNDAANDGKAPPEALTDPEAAVATLRLPNFAKVSYPSDAFRRWSRAFPCRAFFLEDVAERPEETRSAILDHLGASTAASLPIEASHNSKAGRTRAELAPALRDALARHFREELLRCAETFGGPAETWPSKYGFGGGRSTAALDRELEGLRSGGEQVSFAQFYARTALKAVEGDRKHPTLGANLKEGEDWSAAGRRRYGLFRKLSGTEGRAIRVVDYGCGSLRIGQHFIRAGEPESYVGLDVIPDFYRMGLGMMGEEVVAEKRPFLGLIGDEAAEARAAAHGANLVVSSAVAFHVHPDEMGAFVANIDGASRTPGCVVLFDAALHPEEVRYAHRGWARPLGFYRSLFPGLRFAGSHGAKAMRREGRNMSMELLEFRR